MASKEFWNGLFADQIRESSKSKVLTRNAVYRELMGKLETATPDQIAALNERRPNAARCVAIGFLLHAGRTQEAAAFDDNFTRPDVADVTGSMRNGHYADVIGFAGEAH